MNQATEAAIWQHGEKVKARFNLDPTLPPIALCRKLRRLEQQAHRAAEDYCNGDLTSYQYDQQTAAIRRKVLRLLGPTAEDALSMNGDPRGYALKVVPADGLPTDWGGYGLLAPDLTR